MEPESRVFNGRYSSIVVLTQVAEVVAAVQVPVSIAVVAEAEGCGRGVSHVYDSEAVRPLGQVLAHYHMLVRLEGQRRGIEGRVSWNVT